MYKVFYKLSGNYFDASDIKLCLDMSSALAVQDPDLVFTIYLVSKYQLSTLNGVDGLSVNGSSFTYGSIQGCIQTERTYTPKQQREVVLAICILEEKTLCCIQSSPSIHAIFIVPEMPGYIDHWLQLHSAWDINTNSPQPIAGIPSCSIALQRAIGYLKDYTRKLDVDLTHTSIQQGMMHTVFNAFIKNAVQAQYDEAYAECLRRNLSHAEAEILAKAFARKSPYPNTTTMDWNHINDPKWDNN